MILIIPEFLFQNSMSLTSWLNARFPGQSSQPPTQPQPSPSTESFVITLDDEGPIVDQAQSPHDHIHPQRSTNADNFFNNIREASANTVNNSIISNSSGDNHDNHESNEANDEQSMDGLPMRPEAQELFKTIQNHLPFAVLLLTKTIYDHRSGTLCLGLLFVIFVKANNDLKIEIAKQASASGKSLFHILCYIFGALAMTSLVLNDYPFFFYYTYTSFWELLWGVIVTDFVVKLFTVGVKTLLTCLPGKFLAYQKRVSLFFFSLWVFREKMYLEMS